MRTNLVVSALALLAGLAPALAEDFPAKPIDVIIPFGAGGNGDTSARIFLQHYRAALDAEMIPLNKPGAGGTIGMTEVAGAASDGYTLGYTAIAPVTVQPHVRNLQYGRDSFEPVCMVVDIPTAVTVGPDSPYQTMDDLVGAAKAGKVVAAGPAPGSIPHLGQAAVANAYDVEFTYLPVGNGALQAKAILGGDADMATDTAAMEKSHGLRTLAVLSDTRFADLPDVPTLKELGVDLSLTIWFGLVAPAGTPADVLDALSEACTTAMSSPDFLDEMAKANFVVRHMPRDAFSAFYQKQFDDNKALLDLIGPQGG